MFFLKMLGLIIDVMPLTLKMIDVAETAIGPGKGAAKLDMVKNVVQTAYTVAEDVQAPFETLWPVFDTLIGHAVASAKAAPVAVAVQPAAEVVQPAEHPYAPTGMDSSIMM